MIIQNNNYSIAEILEMLESRNLTVNKDYQRGTKLWPDSASAYFIDTIINKFIFPKIYIYEYLDPKTRKVKREIVDGQQRITAIQRFHNDEFKLRDGQHKGLKFSEMPENVQLDFLSYSAPVDVIRNANISEILQMFRRMNAYTLPLNEAEKRHSSYHGQFKWFVNSITDRVNAFFDEWGVMTKKQMTRMTDAALVADITLSIEKGVVSTSPKDLSDLYAKYDEQFNESDNYKEQILEAFNFIISELPDLRSSYMMKPYALHSLITALIHSKYGIAAIEGDWQCAPLGTFSNNVAQTQRILAEMAEAQELKELTGEHAAYVWGCMSTTDRKARRTARVAALLRALGCVVPEEIDANLA